MTDEKEFYMQRAITLAEKGKGRVNPNPLVGAVVVKDGKIIGEGYHEYYGGLHAERNALKNCKESSEGATLYVTLESCCHYGKTPPCTEAILEHRIRKVVVGMTDPNPLMAGKSIALLKSKGVEVEVGVLEKECMELTHIFRKYITTKIPYVLMKYAMTMDGKIATASGKSKWITGETARMCVQKTRLEYQAIMVGSETVRKDDPLLTCRIANGKDPVRIICDTSLRTSTDSQIVKTARQVRTIFATCETNREKIELYQKAGCEVLVVSKKNGKIDLKELVQKIGALGIDSILLEGGGTLNASALEAQIVDRVQTYIAPKIFGGTGIGPVGGMGVDEPADAYQLVNSRLKQIGEDFLIESDVKYKCLQES